MDIYGSFLATKFHFFSVLAVGFRQRVNEIKFEDWPFSNRAKRITHRSQVSLTYASYIFNGSSRSCVLAHNPVT